MYAMCLLCNKFGKVIFLQYYRAVRYAKCDNSLPALLFRDLKIYYCSINHIDELWWPQQPPL